MRTQGINYDTGFLRAGGSTHEPFDPDIVRRELGIIHDDLHCDAVRITGGDLGRLKLATRHAADAGLEVWLSPFTTDLTTDELLAFLADCAEHAETLRLDGAKVVLVTGSELSPFNIGFLPGETLDERLSLLADLPRLRAALPQVPGRINDFLGKAVPIVRERFGGKVTYASIPFEEVDWTPFDIVATDAGYRSVKIADRYRDGVRRLVALGKPVAITEVGCTTHAAAADLGGDANLMVEWDDDGGPRRLRGEYARDETEQAACVLELLDILDAEGVDAAFVYTFARYDLPHRDDPREDFDLASCGVVKVLEGRHGDTYPDMAWEPKAAFWALADYYRR